MKRIFKLASILGLGGLVAGCNSFLDKEPDNRASIDNLDKVSALLVSAYPNRTNMSLLDPRCDYIVDMGATLDGSQPAATFDVCQHVRLEVRGREHQYESGRSIRDRARGRRDQVLRPGHGGRHAGENQERFQSGHPGYRRKCRLRSAQISLYLGCGQRVRGPYGALYGRLRGGDRLCQCARTAYGLEAERNDRGRRAGQE